MDKDGEMTVPHEADFSSPNITPAENEQMSEAQIESQQAITNTDIAAMAGTDAGAVVAAAAALPENDALAAVISSGPAPNQPSEASAPRSRFGLSRRFKATNSDTRSTQSPAFSNAPDFFNQAYENTTNNTGRGGDFKKKIIIIGGVCAAIIIVIIVGLLIFKPANKDSLAASGGLKSKFYEFANKFLSCEDKKDAIVGKYDKKKTYCAGNSWKNKDYVAAVKTKYDSFYKNYTEEKSGQEAYQDIMFEFNDYMSFLFAWSSYSDVTDASFSIYYHKNGRAETIKHFNRLANEQLSGDSGKLVGYRDYVNSYVTALADKYDVYSDVGCLEPSGLVLGACAQAISGDAAARLNAAMKAIDESHNGMVAIREGAFIYSYKQIFELAKIVEGRK